MIVRRTLGLSGAFIDGNLDLSAGRFVRPRMQTDYERDPHRKLLSFAIYANRVIVKGAAFLRNGFAVTGAASFVAAEFGKSFFFEPVLVEDSRIYRVLRTVHPEKDKSAGRIPPIGHDWMLDLDSASIRNVMSIRCLAAGNIFNVDYRTDRQKKPTIRYALEREVVFWSEDEHNRWRYVFPAYYLFRYAGLYAIDSRVNEEVASHSKIDGFLRIFDIRRWRLPKESDGAAQEKMRIKVYKLNLDDPDKNRKARNLQRWWRWMRKFPEPNSDPKQKTEYFRLNSKDPTIQRYVSDGLIIDQTEIWRRQQEFFHASLETRVENTIRKIRETVGELKKLRSLRKRRLFDILHKFRWYRKVFKDGSKETIEKIGVKGIVDLTNATADTYTDDYDFVWRPFHWLRRASNTGVGSWPSGITTMLEGFRYSHIGSRGIDAAQAGIARVKWLKTQYVTTRCFNPGLVILSWAVVGAAAAVITYLNIMLPPDKTNTILLPLPFTGSTLSYGEVGNLLQWTAIGLAPVWIAITKLLFSHRWLPRTWEQQISKLWRLMDGHNVVPDVFAHEEAEVRDKRMRWREYRSQPWLQCAKALRDAGMEEQARRVLLSRERLNSVSDRISINEKVLRIALLSVFGRGLVRFYPVGWFFVVLLIALVIFHVSFELNMMRPAEAVILTHLERTEHENEARPRDVTIETAEDLMIIFEPAGAGSTGTDHLRKQEPNRIPTGYSTPRALIYAFEVMTPGLPMRQENRWGTCPREYIVRAANDTGDHSHLCRTLHPLTRGKYVTASGEDDIHRIPIDTEPFELATLKKASQAFAKQDYVRPCDVVRYYASDRFRIQESDTIATLKKRGRNFYSGITVDACFWGIELEDATLSGESLLDMYYARDMLRHSTWMFIAYGWILIGGFAVSLSQLLLREA